MIVVAVKVVEIVFVLSFWKFKGFRSLRSDSFTREPLSWRTLITHPKFDVVTLTLPNLLTFTQKSLRMPFCSFIFVEDSSSPPW